MILKVPPDQLRQIVSALVDEYDVYHLSTITADQVAEGIVLYYHFWRSGGLSLEVALELPDPRITTIVDLVPGAAFYEREVHGMFGIVFTGHAGLRPLLLSDDWDAGPPLRREDDGG